MNLIDMILNVFNSIFDIIVSPFRSGLDALSDKFQDMFTAAQIAPQFVNFLGACIKTFIPYQAFGDAIALKLPFYTINFTIALIKFGQNVTDINIVKKLFKFGTHL